MKPSIYRLAAFTLIELLVVVSIIALLIALLLPSLAKARVSTLRVTEVSNTRQAVATCLAYSVDRKDELPKGGLVGMRHWSWTIAEPWKEMNRSYGLPLDQKQFGCQSWVSPESYRNSEVKFFRENAAGHWTTPWIYWGHREFQDAGYVTPVKVSDSHHATSDTLLTCFGRETTGAFASMSPHISKHNDFGQITPAPLPWTEPDVMAAGMIDGSTEMHQFSEMEGHTNLASTSRFFYKPR